MSQSNNDPLAEFDQLDENIQLRSSIASLQVQLRNAKAKQEHLSEMARRGAREAFTALGRPPKVPTPKDYKAGEGKPEVAILHLSDWQTGKRTTSYDSDVAEQRIEQLADGFERILDIERSGHPVDEAWLLFGGDFCEGVNVFPGQQYEIDSTLFEQHARASRMATNLTRRVASLVKHVHVVEEDGNHGRLGRRGEMPKGDNADRFIYHATRLQVQDLEKEGRLHWHETRGWYSLFEIGNYRGLLVHGDEIKSFGGQTPAFGIAKKVTAWSAGVIEPFHDCYMGHWHQPLVVPLPTGYRRVFVNPSTESDNIYAQEFVGANGYPGQRLNFVEPKRGRVTSERILWLD